MNSRCPLLLPVLAVAVAWTLMATLTYLAGVSTAPWAFSSMAVAAAGAMRPAQINGGRPFQAVTSTS